MVDKNMLLLAKNWFGTILRSVPEFGKIHKLSVLGYLNTNISLTLRNIFVFFITSLIIWENNKPKLKAVVLMVFLWMG